MNRFVRRLGRLPAISLGTMLGAIALSGSSFAARLAVAPAHAKPISAPLLVADSQSVAELAAHLKKVGAKMYGAYWCPHCKHQKDMFGDAAFRMINYIECDPRGEKAKPDQCKAAKIKGYPTWEIKGKQYEGTQTFAELAKASGYPGKNKF